MIVAVGGGVSVVGGRDAKGGLVSGDGERRTVITDSEITAEIKGICGGVCITVAIGERDGLLNAQLAISEGQIVIAVRPCGLSRGVIEIFKLSEGDCTGSGGDINAEDLGARAIEDTCIACACIDDAPNDIGAIAGPGAIDLVSGIASEDE